MSRVWAWTLCALLLVTSLGMWGKGRTIVGSGLYGEGGYRLLYEDGAELTRIARKELEENETGRYAFVRQKQGMEVSAPALGSVQTLNWLEVYGDAPLVLESLYLQQGRHPSPNSMECLVDAKTAWALWGSDEAIGHLLEFDSREYRVSGVLQSDRPLLLTAFEDKGDFSFSHVYYAARQGTAFPRQARDEFLARAWLSQPTASVNLQGQCAWLRQLCQLPLLLLGGAAAELCLRGLLPGCGWQRWCRWLLRLCALWLLGTALGFSIPFGAEQLPARWSNFSFWSHQLREVRGRALSQWTASGLLPAYLSHRQSLLAVLLSAASSVCLGASLWLAASLVGKTRRGNPDRFHEG